MRYLFLAFAAVLTAFSTFSVVFSDFRAASGSDGITLSWTTSQENGLQDFAVERETQPNSEQWNQIDGLIKPTGAGSSYSFIDKSDNLLKTSSTTLFVYRIRVDGTDGSVAYSSNSSASYSFSGLSGVAKRTWGSIKAMFR